MSVRCHKQLETVNDVSCDKQLQCIEKPKGMNDRQSTPREGSCTYVKSTSRCPAALLLPCCCPAALLLCIVNSERITEIEGVANSSSKSSNCSFGQCQCHLPSWEFGTSHQPILDDGFVWNLGAPKSWWSIIIFLLRWPLDWGSKTILGGISFSRQTQGSSWANYFSYIRYLHCIPSLSPWNMIIIIIYCQYMVICCVFPKYCNSQ